MVPCYTCLDQNFPDDTAVLAQNNTPDRQETAHRQYSITKHQHTIIRAIIHETNKETQLKQYTNSIKTV
jgi:Ni,Fe-hydrogenase I small subunit